MIPRVLVCDDTKFMRMMIVSILSGAGIEVVGEAENDIEAIDQYKKLGPDVVTLEMEIPEIGGIDTLRGILQHDESARVIMCAVTGQGELISEAEQLGAKVLLKPFASEGLVSLVNEVFVSHP